MNNQEGQICSFAWYINEILREQLTGIRVVRAFVREPEEKERFSVANDAVTQTALATA